MTEKDTSDIIVCVHEVDNGGSADTPNVLFLNLTALEADTQNSCKRFAKDIRKAMTGKQRIYGTGPKMGSTPDFADDDVYKHEVDFPCLVSDFVTLFVG